MNNSKPYIVYFILVTSFVGSVAVFAAEHKDINADISFSHRHEFVAADLGSDGTDELIISAAQNEKPLIALYRQNGTKINEFLAYAEDFEGGVDIATGDLNSDGSIDIVAIPHTNGGPHVRVFDGYGKELSAFFAYNKDTRNTLFVDITASNQIAVLAQTNDKLLLRIFSFSGALQKELTIDIVGNTLVNDFAIADLGTDGTEEIIVATQNGHDTQIAQYRLWDGSFIRSFKPFGNGHREPIAISKGDYNNDGIINIVSTTGFNETVQVKVFSGYGDLLKHETPFEESFIGGGLASVVHNSGSSPELFVLKQRIPSGDTVLGDYIEINRDKQQLTYYIAGYQQDEFPVSSGAVNYETPEGEYQIHNHHPRAWSARYGLYMPYWMAFTPDGKYGIHELPEWPSGYKEGEDHLGTPVSHGCVRLGVGAAEKLYNWADVGTPVIIK